jgi:5-formyltetrahydrofolate cyclo-ligase
VANRTRLDAHALAVAARELRDVVLGAAAVAEARRVAAYVSVGREPGTGPLIESLSDRGVDIVLPLLLPDGDLDWAPYTGPHDLAPAPRGMLAPTAEALGPDAVSRVDVILVPGLAADRRGTRLGRGGGSYDRVLARLAGRAFSCVLLHRGELLDIPIPREPHDVPVDAAADPSGFRRLGRSHPAPG